MVLLLSTNAMKRNAGILYKICSYFNRVFVARYNTLLYTIVQLSNVYILIRKMSATSRKNIISTMNINVLEKRNTAFERVISDSFKGINVKLIASILQISLTFKRNKITHAIYCLSHDFLPCAFFKMRHKCRVKYS